MSDHRLEAEVIKELRARLIRSMEDGIRQEIRIMELERALEWANTRLNELLATDAAKG